MTSETPLDRWLLWLRENLEDSCTVVILTSPLWYLGALWLMNDDEWNYFMTKLETWVKIDVKNTGDKS